MAISEETRKIAAALRATKGQQIAANLKDIQEHKDAITKLQAINVQIKTECDALANDIPTPTEISM